MFWQNIFLVELWNIMLNFSTFSVRGCWGQSILLFQELVFETKISKPQDFRTTFKWILACIFLTVRPKLLVTFHYEIPCNESLSQKTTCKGNIFKYYLGLLNSQTIEIKFWLDEKKALLSLRIICMYTILTSKELFVLGDNITTTISTKWLITPFFPVCFAKKHVVQWCSPDWLSWAEHIFVHVYFVVLYTYAGFVKHHTHFFFPSLLSRRVHQPNWMHTKHAWLVS